MDTTTVHTTDAFVKAVKASSVSDAIQNEAIHYFMSNWDGERLLYTIPDDGPDMFQFSARGAKLTAQVSVETTDNPLPVGLTTSQHVLEEEIGGAQLNYVGAGAFWQEYFAHPNLQLGAMATLDGPGVEVVDYLRNGLTVSLYELPTARP